MATITTTPNAPIDATYVTQTANGVLTAEQALSSLSTGLMQVTTTTGAITSVTTSAGISGLLSDETGSGALVFGTAPTISNPTLQSWTGWIQESATWTRTGNFTFTVSGDVTTYLYKGVRVRYKDGGSFEYGTIKTSSHAAGTTTVTLISNDDYTMAAATITEPAYSYLDFPQGFPPTFNFTSQVTWTGFSANPATYYAQYSVFGGLCYYQMRTNSNGTSNATTLTATLPITSGGITNGSVRGMGTGVDNGTNLTTPVLSIISTGDTTIALFKDCSAAAWTNSGSKRADWVIYYPI